ncbi:MAG: EAL domain-containing protein [Zoogloea sp.]|nr:EAL domain-containing protein [Zoogloea sp.]
MQHKDGRRVWVQDRGKVVKWTEDGRPLMMSGTHADITSRKEAEEQIQRLAFYDPLTQLPNRRLLLDRLGQAQAAGERTRQYGALMLIDLDHFKNLNDTMGHGVGDQLLVEVAKRLNTCVRAGDTVARFGGDEFVVMLPGLSDDEAVAARIAETIAEKVRKALNLPYAFRQAELAAYHNTPSIGVSLFRDHDESIDTLLRQSDLAMYQAKDAGRNAIRFYNPDMQASIDARASIEAGLRKALAGGELHLHFQPQVNIQGTIVGAEALLRWHRPGIQNMSPDKFIPVAEETGLILPIGSWVLDFACATLKEWGGSSFPGRLNLAVNVSARQFHQADFAEQVERMLDRYGTDPSLLKLELTESLILDNVEDAIEKMRALKKMGVSFSLDDFGTGYSSLSYLKRLPIDQLKIDRSFVRDIASDPDDAAIVQAILGMSQALRLDVVAEGVENELQRHFLHQNGCRTFQGYLFSKPLPLAEFERLVH